MDLESVKVVLIRQTKIAKRLNNKPFQCLSTTVTCLPYTVKRLARWYLSIDEFNNKCAGFYQQSLQIAQPFLVENLYELPFYFSALTLGEGKLLRSTQKLETFKICSHVAYAAHVAHSRELVASVAPKLTKHKNYHNSKNYNRWQKTPKLRCYFAKIDLRQCQTQ